MNKMRLFKAVVLAAISSFVVACTTENTQVETPQGEKYVTVGLNCAGEILDVEESPMSKVYEFDLYQIQVYSMDKRSMPDGGFYYDQIPYAHGQFDSSLDGVTIKLIEGKEYKFEVAILIGARWEQPMEKQGEFVYTTQRETPYMSVDYDSYYGELDGYIASAENNVTIYTKRVVYALECIAEGLNEGILEVSALDHADSPYYSFTLSPDHLVHERVYSFFDYRSAWEGFANGENYNVNKRLEIRWTKDNGEVVPIGVFEVNFKRNVRTTVRIKVEELSKTCGITIVKEEVPVEDDNKEYCIQGGTVTEVPVNSGN